MLNSTALKKLIGLHQYSAELSQIYRHVARGRWGGRPSPPKKKRHPKKTWREKRKRRKKERGRGRERKLSNELII